MAGRIRALPRGACPFRALFFAPSRKTIVRTENNAVGAGTRTNTVREAGCLPSRPGALNFTHKYTLDTVRVRNPSGWA